jgi:hypothetical protein
VGKDKLSPNARLATVHLLNLLPIFFDGLLKHWPFYAADKATLHPAFCVFRLNTISLPLDDLLVKPTDDLLTSVHPFVPIPPNERASVAFFFEEFDTIMQLAHTFRNLLGGFWNA